MLTRTFRMLPRTGHFAIDSFEMSSAIQNKTHTQGALKKEHGAITCQTVPLGSRLART